MGLLKVTYSMRTFSFILLFFLYSFKGWADSPFSSQVGKILFLIQQGQHSQALSLYEQYYEAQKFHDFELIHRIGLGLLDYGFRQQDPEIQLLTLFGASVAAHEEAYYILEESLKSPYPMIELVALKALAHFQTDRASQALKRALGSNYLLIRLEAAHHLCEKKDPQAIDQTESLMYKTSKELLSFYPALYAKVGTPQAICLLRKMLNHSKEKVRVAAILSAAKYGRDDLLPQIRQQASHFNFAQQEASAYALGLLKDEESISRLKRLGCSQYPTVALAAQQALYRLGQKEAIKAIREAAIKGDVFAIAILGEIQEEARTLLELIHSSNIQIRVNATLALLEQNHSQCCKNLQEILIRDKRDLAFTRLSSPGQALKAWKAVPFASQILKNDVSAYTDNIELKESILEKAQNLSENDFLQLAELLLLTQQNDLVPVAIELVEDLETPKAIQLLMKYQQMIGAPLIRQYCNLALYRLKEPGPYGDQLRQWVQSWGHREFIHFRPFTPWSAGKNNYELTPEETSRLLIESFEAFTINQDDQGITALLKAIRDGHQTNKYALAGLLLRATH